MGIIEGILQFYGHDCSLGCLSDYVPPLPIGINVSQVFH